MLCPPWEVLDVDLAKGPLGEKVTGLVGALGESAATEELVLGQNHWGAWNRGSL